MASIYYLTSEDFVLMQGQTGVVMCNKIPNLSLILYYSKNCNYCQDLVPIFKDLPYRFQGCTFGLANILLDNQAIVQMARTTVIPISYVPFIVLYVNGKPFMEYKGPRSTKEIVDFLNEVFTNLQQRQHFARSQPPEIGSRMGEGSVCQGGVPGLAGYCHGVPFTDNVCFVSYGDAYNEKTVVRPQTEQSDSRNYTEVYGTHNGEYGVQRR